MITSPAKQTVETVEWTGVTMNTLCVPLQRRFACRQPQRALAAAFANTGHNAAEPLNGTDSITAVLQPCRVPSSFPMIHFNFILPSVSSSS